METEKRIAVLIDSDNISPKYLRNILDEVSSYGRLTYRRIYGDWSAQNLSSWRKLLLDSGFLQIQQSRYVTSKNATDAAMIIDAMDILYGKAVDIFCLVTSDSDFSRLAIRLRESGMEVIGMGERKTPSAFIASCTMFKYLDVLTSDEDETDHAETVQTIQSTPTTKPDESDDQSYTIAGKKEILNAIKDFVQSALDHSTFDEQGVNIATLGSHLQKRFPEFDVRNYGFSKLSTFLESLEGVNLVHQGLKVFIKVDESKPLDKKEILAFIKKTLKENPKGMKIFELNKKIIKEFPNFDIHALGYSKLSRLLFEDKTIDLKWNTVKLS